jgi:hypothetical protein
MSGFQKGSYLVPEDQMLAIGSVLVRAEDVCEAFDAGLTMQAEDFVDEVASKVYDLRKALKELKDLKHE